MQKRYILIFMAGILLLVTGCLSLRSEKSLPIVPAQAPQPQTSEVQMAELPKDYFYIQADDVDLLDESGQFIRRLFFQERVFLVRKGLQRSVVQDYAGNQGYVDRNYLGKNFVPNIIKEFEGVEYGLYQEKIRPITNYFPVRGVYMSFFHFNRVDQFLAKLEGTPINSIVIDYKDDYDQLLFDSEATKEVLSQTATPLIENPEEFIAKFKERGYHLIARIVVFKSSNYASEFPERSVVRKNGNLFYSDLGYWVSPHNRDMWEYMVKLANEALEYGFDEIQFDYIRFPVTYGAEVDFRSPMNEGKVEAIQKFIMYVQSHMKDKNVVIGSDIFGWSAVSISDENIGQHWEAMSAVSDVICPMFYPSLYAPGNLNIARPWEEPYLVTKLAAEIAIQRNGNIPTASIIRPWLQAYSGHNYYGDKEIADQVRALYDLGIYEYMLWNVDGQYNLGGLNDIQKHRPVSP